MMVIKQNITKVLNIDVMQFGFMPGTMDAIFTACQMQQKVKA